MVRLRELLKAARKALRGWGLIAALYALCAVCTLVQRPDADADALPIPTQQAVLNLWVQLALLVVSWAVSYYMRPDPITPEPRKANVPIVEDGKPIGVIFGDVMIPDSMVLAFKQLRAIKIEKEDQTVGYWYEMLLHFGLGLAIDGLTQIIGGGRIAWSGRADSSQRIAINALELWGGKYVEGGIGGDADLMLGEPTDPPNPMLAAELGTLQPAYRGKATLAFRGLVGAINPYPKPWEFRCHRALVGWEHDSPWYPETAVVLLAGGTVRAMNPAHILYESITNTDWGQGEPAGLIDDASFRAAADTLAAEGFGLCTTYEGDSAIEDFQARIVNVIGASLSQSRTTGKYHLDLVRDDYVLEDLPVITEDDVLEIEAEPSQAHEAINQILVDWYDPNTRQNRATAPVQALGSISTLGTVVSETHRYREVPTEGLALLLARRDLRARSAPRSRFKLVLNRRNFDLRPGLPFRLQVPSAGYADVVLRAGDITYGRLTNARMRVTAIEDVFAMPATVYVQPEPGLYVPPDPTPQPAAYQQAIETPYLQLARRVTPGALAALAPEIGYLSTMAVRPPGLALNYTLSTAAEGESYAGRGTGDWCPSATVLEAAGKVATGVTLGSGTDLDLVRVGAAALWGEEIVRVDALDIGTGALTLGRGCGDTVPVDHAAGERIWFVGAGYAGTDRREYLDGETVSAKLLTRTGSAELDPALAPTLTVAMDQRQARPYPPGDLTINGARYPATVTGPVTVAWAHRDRVLQADQLVDALAASIGPEAGTTYTVRLLQADTQAELALQSGISGTAATVDTTFEGPVLVEAWSSRDGLDGWQRLRHQFAYLPSEMVVSGEVPSPLATGVAYSADLSVNVGQPPVAWSISAGALPAGLAMDPATGTISGTATEAGLFGFTARATDAQGFQGETAFVLEVVAEPAILGDPPPLVAGEPYSFQPSVINLDPPVSWSVSAGALPAGLTLNASTGEVSGTPTATTLTTFTLAAADADASAVRQFTLGVPERAAATVLMIVASTSHGATSNTRQALLDAGFTDANIIVQLETVSTIPAADIILIVRGCADPTEWGHVQPAWAAGTPVVFGSSDGATDGSGGFVWAATSASLTGTMQAHQGSTNELLVVDSSHYITSIYPENSRLGILAANNFGEVLDAGAAYVGQLLGTGDPDDPGVAGQPSLIAVPAGTIALDGSTTPARAVVWGDLYGGQSAYTIDGAELLGRCIDWCRGAG